MESGEHPLIVIAGPTGSGKSALALKLAARFGGEIVNCDSMQIYRGFDIGTAKTPAEQRDGVPHHLFDVFDLLLFDVSAPQMRYSAGEYARQARQILQEIAVRKAIPVVVGGTGFYLRALLNGLPFLPDRDESMRSKLLARERLRPGSLHRILARLDHRAAAAIHGNDIQKLTRALEIRILTNAPRADARDVMALQGFTVLKIGLDPDREALIRRLDTRAEEMFRCGLLEEVRNLLAAGLNGTEKPFESLGYKQAVAHLRGEVSLANAIESTQIQTRQYAKRQRTWFKRETGMRWINDFGDSLESFNKALALVADFTCVR